MTATRFSEPPSHNVTALLVAWGDGDESALARLMPIVHEELHRIARGCMAGEKGGHTAKPRSRRTATHTMPHWFENAG